MKIRRQLGPHAVVLNVRQLPPEGLSKLWKKPRIEVLACMPEKKQDLPAINATADSDVIRALIKEVQGIKRQMNERPRRTLADVESEAQARAEVAPAPPAAGTPDDEWRVVEVLQASGLLPLHAFRILELLQIKFGNQAPESFQQELEVARSTLRNLWREVKPVPDSSRSPHILIGPAGSGKTTCLCKWLTQVVLVEDQHAHVWRLDGAKANSAEMLSIYGEILGVPVERTWSGPPEVPPAQSFIDLPGIQWWDASEMRELRERVESLFPAQLHLTLNIAYEMPQIMAQVRAFADFPLRDIIVTHLDEEVRWGKIWNLVMGSDFPVRFLNAGQNIPGDFLSATPELIFSRQFSQ